MLHYQWRLNASCMFYQGQSTKLENDTVVLEMSWKIEDIWNKADCCPFTFKHIAELFERDIWQKYLYLKQEKYLPEEHAVQKRLHK